jgi:PAS domain S-box-containing protein
VLDFIEAPQLARALTDLAAVVTGQSPAPVTYQLRRADGGFAAGQVSSIPLKFADQPAMLSFVADVTEHEQLAMELRESEERYLLLFDSIPVGTMVTINGLITYANEIMWRALGATERASVEGHLLEGFLDEASRQRIERASNRAVLVGASGVPESVTLTCVDGTTIDAIASFSTIHWQGAAAVQTLICQHPVAATPR